MKSEYDVCARSNKGEEITACELLHLMHSCRYAVPIVAASHPLLNVREQGQLHSDRKVYLSGHSSLKSGMASKYFYNDIEDKKVEREKLLRSALSNLIRKQRKYCKESMTQEELAFRSGISYEHLNHIENAKAMASIEVLDRIARALGFHRLSEFLACDESKVL